MAVRGMTVPPHSADAGPDSPSGGAIVTTAVASAIILGCGIVTGLIAARSLGPTGRGELATITVWATVLLYAGTLGLPEAVAYFSAAGGAARERIWTTGQIASAFLGILITAVGWWLIPVMFSAREDAPVQAMRWYLVLFAVPGCASLCASAWLQGAGLLRAYNISRSSIHVINAAGSLSLFAVGDHSVVHFAAVMLIGNAAGWAIAAAHGPWDRFAAAPASADAARRMFHYGFRVQVGNWSNAASVRLDQLLLSLFAPASALGLYVVAVTYANVLQTIPGSASTVMLPEVVRQHQAGAAGACVERWYRRALWMTVSGAAPFAAASMILVPFLFGDSFRDAVPLVMVLVPATIMLGMNQLLSTAFRGLGRPGVGSKSELIGVVVTVVALVLLLPRYGVFGAAVASLLAYTSSHVYLLRQVRPILGGGPTGLYALNGDDLKALRSALHTARLRVTRAASAPSARTQELVR
jgi:O-antigen/teichoic acid export membrane protein